MSATEKLATDRRAALMEESLRRDQEIIKHSTVSSLASEQFSL